MAKKFLVYEGRFYRSLLIISRKKSSRARPKSTRVKSNLVSLQFPNNKFCGLMSRWMMPHACTFDRVSMSCLPSLPLRIGPSIVLDLRKILPT